MTTRHAEFGGSVGARTEFLRRAQYPGSGRLFTCRVGTTNGVPVMAWSG